MISRRDKLWKSPWEERKYENHLRKINSAAPVIDNKPPVTRQHVAVKLKKRQMEIERMRQIESDNLILLRRINYVTNTNRVDNWHIPPQQAKYLNRVPLSNAPSQRPSTCHASLSCDRSAPKPDANGVDLNQNKLRKSRCFACSPYVMTAVSKLDSTTRMPCQMPNVRGRSRSLPLIKPQSEANLNRRLPRVDVAPHAWKFQKQTGFDNNETHKLVISSGSLRLCVKFPSDSLITLNEGTQKKTVFGRSP